MSKHGNNLRSQYVWRDEGAGKRLLIQDLCIPGCKSVTNDAENVIADFAAHNIDVDQREVLYRDSTGRWDRMVTEKGEFLGFELANARIGSIA